ncbi:hypothetical protein ACEN9F_09365 [Duganella sp. CT11-25]|jgi:hypothetical protein|uniref:hypothetical protein n=1 Tax=unclassified Duganella TaxID=2636909 RepID=UPI0039AEC7AA
MNRYDVLFNEIFAKTKSGQLQWKHIGREENAALILNAHLVFRQFSAELPRGRDVFTLLLVEKRHLYNDEDFFIERFETYRAELLVVQDGELVATLGDAVKLSAMMELARMVETDSDRIRKLFDTQI